MATNAMCPNFLPTICLVILLVQANMFVLVVDAFSGRTNRCVPFCLIVSTASRSNNRIVYTKCARMQIAVLAGRSRDCIDHKLCPMARSLAVDGRAAQRMVPQAEQSAKMLFDLSK